MTRDERIEAARAAFWTADAAVGRALDAALADVGGLDGLAEQARALAAAQTASRADAARADGLLEGLWDVYVALGADLGGDTEWRCGPDEAVATVLMLARVVRSDCERERERLLSALADASDALDEAGSQVAASNAHAATRARAGR